MFFVRRTVLALIVILLPLGAVAAQDGDAELWNALRDGGHAVLLRHAIAPGTGDPANFTLEDCATQRNLSEEGRAQARAIGERFGREDAEPVAVLTSRWCRSRDTATEAFGEEAVEDAPAFDSFFARRERADAQTADAVRLVAERTGENGPLVVVTHQVNITALTGIVPRQGEGVVVRPSGDGVEVVGRLGF